MRFITVINNKKCLEWNVTATQGALISLIYEANTWAKEIVINDKVYYYISRNLILQELPLFFEKSDTVYRNLKILSEKGIIEYTKQGKKDLIRLTAKGKTWNFVESEKEEKISEVNPDKVQNTDRNPTKLGNKSDKTSDFNPINKDTDKHKDTTYNDYIYKSEEFWKAFKNYQIMRKKIKKPMTDGAIERMLKRIEKITGGNNEDYAIKLLNKSEDKCWLDVYEIMEISYGNSRKNSGQDKHRKEPDYKNSFKDWN